MSSEASVDVSAVPPSDTDSAFQDEATTASKPRKKVCVLLLQIFNVGPSDVDSKQLLVAVLCFLFVAAIGIGVGFAIKNNGDAATTAEADSTVPSCEKSFQSFSTDGLKLTMIVKGSITQDDIQYAEGIFSKTYLEALENGFNQEEGFCDPYCRSISNLTATYSEVMVAEESETVAVDARQADDDECDTVAELTFSVQGEFWGCDDAEFPGLFSNGGERRNLKTSLRSRFLAPDDESCPVCSEDSETTGMAPSQEDLTKALKVYITVLPNICELESVEVV
ncbi:MAG: hypothetical protein SGARI_004838 [Bacillariaceae sp.]